MQLACKACGKFGNNLDEATFKTFKHITQSVISSKNAAVHFELVTELKEMVTQCMKAITLFPNLEDEFPYQCCMIQNFEGFKLTFPNEFKDN